MHRETLGSKEWRRTVHWSASGSSFSSFFISTSEASPRVSRASFVLPLSKMKSRARLPSLLRSVRKASVAYQCLVGVKRAANPESVLNLARTNLLSATKQ